MAALYRYVKLIRGIQCCADQHFPIVLVASKLLPSPVSCKEDTNTLKCDANWKLTLFVLKVSVVVVRHNFLCFQFALNFPAHRSCQPAFLAWVNEALQIRIIIPMKFKVCITEKRGQYLPPEKLHCFLLSHSTNPSCAMICFNFFLSSNIHPV